MAYEQPYNVTQVSDAGWDYDVPLFAGMMLGLASAFQFIAGISAVLKDDTELFKQFMDNESFRRWLTDTVFGITYDRPTA